MKKYHYVYRVTNLYPDDERLYYVGKRSSNNKPNEDIGIHYFTSGIIKEDFKHNPNNYKIKIIKLFDTSEDAILFESKYHKRLDVKSHKKFYNMANQNGNTFDTTGYVRIINDDGSSSLILRNEYNKNKHSIFSKDHFLGKDKNGEIVWTTIYDERIKRGEIVHYAKGMVSAKDENGNHVYISVNEYYSGNYTSFNENKFAGIDQNGKTYLIDKNDPRVLNGDIKSMFSGKVIAKNLTTGAINFVEASDFDNDDNLVGINYGKVSGSNNPNAKQINIYNNVDELVVETYGDFEKICNELELPFVALKRTYLKNTKITIRSKYKSFVGWYAKIIN